jgi:hypothetical protein
MRVPDCFDPTWRSIMKTKRHYSPRKAESPLDKRTHALATRIKDGVFRPASLPNRQKEDACIWAPPFEIGSDNVAVYGNWLNLVRRTTWRVRTLMGLLAWQRMVCEQVVFDCTAGRSPRGRPHPGFVLVRFESIGHQRNWIMAQIGFDRCGVHRSIA